VKYPIDDSGRAASLLVTFVDGTGKFEKMYIANGNFFNEQKMISEFEKIASAYAFSPTKNGKPYCFPMSLVKSDNSNQAEMEKKYEERGVKMSEIANTISKKFPRIRDIYNKHLQTQSFSGRVHLALQISSDGKVTSTEIVDSMTVKNELFINEIKAECITWVLPASSKGLDYSIDYPLIFTK
jgi:hypothetical protein